ncbi:hypothetical protein C0989_006637 [Termitomyces sp. Mn162]|nr:hypothetical protein C0989_006637 [Termitomyces sp. Mn162]
MANACFFENSKVDMCTHLTNLVVIKEHLAKISCPLSDSSFISYIHTSLSLAPTYKPLFTMLATSAHTSRTSVLSQDLIWHLDEEANSTAIETSINYLHEAMIVAHPKACSGSNIEKGEDKPKKDKEKHHCNNCDKDEHTKDKCFKDGEGMAGKAPELWLKKHKGKRKDKVDKSKSANAAKTKEKGENYAFLTFPTIDASDNDISYNVALAIMSIHSYEAHATSPSAGIILIAVLAVTFCCLVKIPKILGNQPQACPGSQWTYL